MSLLSELKSIAESLNIKVETGVFSDTPPDEYIVLTPLSDSFEMHCDNLPEYEIQEVRISIFSKGNYTALKRKRESMYKGTKRNIKSEDNSKNTSVG